MNKTYYKRKKKSFLEWCYSVFFYGNFSLYWKGKKRLYSKSKNIKKPFINKTSKFKNFNSLKTDHYAYDSKKNYLTGISISDYKNKYDGDPWYGQYKTGSSETWNNDFDKKHPIDYSRPIHTVNIDRKEEYDIRRELLNLEYEDRRKDLYEKWENKRK